MIWGYHPWAYLRTFLEALESLCSGGTTRCWSSLRMLACLTYGQKSKGQIHFIYLWLFYLCFTYGFTFVLPMIYCTLIYPYFRGMNIHYSQLFGGSPGYQGFDPWPIAIEPRYGFKPREGKCRADTIFSPCHEGLPQRPTDKMIRRWRW